MYDLVIANGRLVDGTGNPWRYADVAVEGGKIVALGKNLGAADEVLDAEGLVVSPGFVDMHAHSDFEPFMSEPVTNKVLMGVTSEVNGNCSFSAAPMSPEHSEELKAHTSFIIGRAHPSWEWMTFEDYLDCLEGAAMTTNFIPLTGHGAVRIASMGFEDSVPSDDEMEDMKEHLTKSFQEGSFGFSAGLIYPPSSFASKEELIEFNKVVAEHGRLFTVHVRSLARTLNQAVSEMIDVARQSGVALHISHHCALGKANWGKVRESIRQIDEGRREGIDITCDQHPYDAASTILRTILPPWVFEEGTENAQKRLKDPDFRERVRMFMYEDRDDWENFLNIGSLDKILIASCPSNPDYEGSNLSDLAAENGTDALEFTFDLLSKDLEVAVIFLEVYSEDDTCEVMRHPVTAIGSDNLSASTGLPHRRGFGTFAKVLGEFVREKKVIPLEEAIRRMTVLPSTRLGLSKRGMLAPGWAADITVFDFENVNDLTTYQEPKTSPSGFVYVLVNGEVVVRDGQFTGKCPGATLRKTDYDECYSPFMKDT